MRESEKMQFDFQRLPLISRTPNVGRNTTTDPTAHDTSQQAPQQ